MCVSEWAGAAAPMVVGGGRVQLLSVCRVSVLPSLPTALRFPSIRHEASRIKCGAVAVACSTPPPPCPFPSSFFPHLKPVAHGIVPDKVLVADQLADSPRRCGGCRGSRRRCHGWCGNFLAWRLCVLGVSGGKGRRGLVTC